MKKLLIFDLDGTLADTLPAITASLGRAWREMGWPAPSLDAVRATVGNGAKHLVRGLMPKEYAADEAVFARVYAAYDTIYRTDYLETKKEHIYAGLPAVLATLRERGYTLAVLSNKQEYMVKGLAAALFPTGTFAAVRGQCELPRKPDPAVPLLIASELGAAPADCAFIGDSEVDVKTAHNAGMQDVACAWGFRSEGELLVAGASTVIYQPTQLLNLFL